LGEVNEKRSYKNLEKTQRSFHSPVRLYYMTRNFFYLKKKYHNQFIKELSAHKTDLLNRIKNKLLYQNNHIKTLQYLFIALRDYKKNKMGKRF
jgi:rhamnosyltransferase